MNMGEYCVTCQQEKLSNDKHQQKHQKTLKPWLSFDKTLPALLAILVIVTAIQAMEISSLKNSLTSEVQAVTVQQAAPPVQQSGSAYQALPSQVGGC